MPDHWDRLRLTYQHACCRLGWQLHNHELLLSSSLLLLHHSRLLPLPKPPMQTAPSKLVLEKAVLQKRAEAAEARVLELQQEAREHAAAAGQAIV